MINQLALVLIFLIAISLLLAFTEWIYRKLGLKGEITRKFAHFTATLSTLVFPYLFTDHWYVLFLAVVFFCLLFFSQQVKKLKSIHDIERKSVGSYLLPIAIYLTFYLSIILGNKFYYILPILILGISDPIAGILGLNVKKNNHRIRIFGYALMKTMLGSFAFFISSFLICITALYYYRMHFDLKTFVMALTIALVSTLVELFSWRGSDNLFIPMSVIVTLILFLTS